jgi:hypothetical protein
MQRGSSQNITSGRYKSILQHNLLDKRASSKITTDEDAKLWAILDNVRTAKDEQDEMNESKKHNDKWMTYKNQLGNQLKEN